MRMIKHGESDLPVLVIAVDCMRIKTLNAA